MRELPILYSTEMVQALLAGRKTMTRRIVKPQPYIDSLRHICSGNISYGVSLNGTPNLKNFAKCAAKYQPGDILYVRETFQDFGYLYFKAGCTDVENSRPRGWISPVFMPKSAARIWLQVTDIRAERLWDISQKDAIAEGIEIDGKGWKALWVLIYGQESYDANPWVWVISFNVLSISGKPENI